MKVYVRAYVHGSLEKTSKSGNSYLVIPAVVGMTPMMLSGSPHIEIETPGEYLLECRLRRDPKNGFSLWVSRVLTEDEEI